MLNQQRFPDSVLSFSCCKQHIHAFTCMHLQKHSLNLFMLGLSCSLALYLSPLLLTTFLTQEGYWLRLLDTQRFDVSVCHDVLQHIFVSSTKPPHQLCCVERFCSSRSHFSSCHTDTTLPVWATCGALVQKYKQVTLRGCWCSTALLLIVIIVIVSSDVAKSNWKNKYKGNIPKTLFVRKVIRLEDILIRITS